MLRRLGIRGKFLAALSVPVLVLFALAGTISMQAVEDVRVARTVNELLGSLEKARDLTVALQAERDATMAFLLSNRDDAEELRAEVDASRAAVDRAIGAAQVAAVAIDLESLDPVVQRAVTGLDDQLGALQNLRSTVDVGGVTMRNVFNGYSAVVERVTAFPSVVANALDDRRLATIINAQTQTMQLVEDYKQEQVLGRAVLDGARSNADIQELLRTLPATNVQQDSTTLTVAQLELGDEVVVPPVRVGLQSYGNIRSIPLGGEQTFLTFITSAQWYQLAGTQAAEYDELMGQLRGAAQSRADVVEASAFRTAVLTISLTVLAVVISIAIAFTVARQIVEPLRRLTLAAGQVRDELPRLVEQVSVPGQGPDLALARIPVTSRDEVGRLAEAFNEVNATTITVAQEQAALRGSIAEMFVNVARRDQVLLNRQLSFIDALERSEEDPATLADLFRLDHLATRMRRNAESLLVLAGIDTGRRLREPLPVSDVIRTASSEIEHYERIHLSLPVDPLMLGHVALPAAHLLAELLENATVFSDPGTPVQVSTGIDETHVVVTVLDQGLGMTAAELAEANAKIRTTSASDVVGAQRLGLFVVGRIAGRLGAEVELGLGPDGTGTLATVRIPVVLFVDTASIPITAPVAAGVARAEETFAPVEEAAVVVHDTAFAPAPAHVQDVSPGSLGSAENPAAEVDLAALTDGQTGHGLPRRRSRGADVEAPAPSVGYREEDDAAAAPSIPLAPRAEALAGAATLPSDDAWSPAVVEAQPLVARRRAEETETAASAAAPLPVREPAAATGQSTVVEGALPTRTPALPTRTPAPDLPTRSPAAGLPTRTPAPQVPEAAVDDAVDGAAAAQPESRAAMFSGFRSRRAELAAAAVDQLPEPAAEPAALGDGADRLAAAAAFFGRGPGAPSSDDAAAVPSEPEPEPEPAPEALVIPALEDDEEYPPSLLGAVENRSGGRHAYREDDLAWPPAVDSVEDTWAAPTEDATWSPPEPTPTPEPETWSPPVLEPAGWAPEQTWDATPSESTPQAEWAPQQSWDAAEQEESAPAVPALVEDAPEQQAPAWQAESSAWQAESPAWQAESPAWQAEPSAWGTPGEESAAPGLPVASPWSPVTQAASVAPAVAAADAAPGADAPAVAAAATLAGPVSAAPDTAAPDTAAPETAAPDTSAPAKRRWWQRGRGKEQQAAAVTPTAAALQPVLPDAPAATWPVLDTPPAPAVPAAPAAPVRASAWGPSEAGAHALPTVAPETPAAPVPGAGATAFFPAVHATRDAYPDVPVTDAPPAEVVAAPPAGEHGWDVPSPRPMPPQPVEPPADAGGSWAPQAWDAPEEPQWRPTVAPSTAEPTAATADAGLSHRTPGAAQQSFAPAPLPAFQPGPTTFTPEPAGGTAGFDAEVNTMLAQRADLAQQALAELSQLSTYRPQAVTGSGSTSLARRTPAAVPAAPEITTSPNGQRPERDANQVRSLLSSFQSGTSRGRMAVDGAQTAGTGAPGTGAEEGPGSEGDQLAAVPTDSDLPQRSTSW